MSTPISANIIPKSKSKSRNTTKNLGTINTEAYKSMEYKGLTDRNIEENQRTLPRKKSTEQLIKNKAD